MLPLSAVLPILLALLQAGPPDDPRDAYDVLAYRLDLRVDPGRRTISGDVATRARVTAERLDALVLDLVQGARVERVRHAYEPAPGRASHGAEIDFLHEGDRLVCRLPDAAERDEVVTLVVTYAVEPRVHKRLFGVHWEETEDGLPWVNTFSFLWGAHEWWPCKASVFHPEDKADELRVDLTVPEGLIGVSNGRLLGSAAATKPPRSARTEDEGARRWTTFHWSHPYPITTYAVALHVGPFVPLARQISIPGVAGEVPFVAYVLPQNREAAQVQFAEVEKILDVYSRRFGPFPFPKSKVGIVEVDYFGMGHATAVGYGSTYPTWRQSRGLPDPRRFLNRYFDHVLVHEFAHEWWGNSVSVSDWSDMWLLEGLASYSAGVYLEDVSSRELADRYFHDLAQLIPKNSRLAADPGTRAASAYSTAHHYKGAAVLNLLRHCIDDDGRWWEVLRTFHERHRHGHATTRDLVAVLEERTGESWERFFDEWVYGCGLPALDGDIVATETGVQVDVDNFVESGEGFHLPLDLEWTVESGTQARRVDLEPGFNDRTIECGEAPRDLRVVNLHRVPGWHRVRVR